VPTLEEEVRAGSRVLSLFANPLNVRVLRSHAEGPKRIPELREAVGWSPESTARAAIATLCEFGAVERVAPVGGARGGATSLSPAGEELLFVADSLQAWLARYPAGPIALDTEEGKGAVKALAGGWSSALVRELASRPTTLGDLNSRLPDISYPALERRLNWMRMTGQIEPVEVEGRGIPYRPTEWLRRAISPLAASGRWERRHLADEAAPVTGVEVEAALLLFLPLAPLPEHAHGNCLLAVHTDTVGEADEPDLAGVTVTVERGKVVDGDPQLAPDPPTWAVGPPEAWLDAVLDGRLEDMRLGGTDLQLALDLVAGLHMGLMVER
jgi:DNA-binding HxlR family transcriptional regulator